MNLFADLHDRAKELLEPAIHDYYAGGAADEFALADNENSFARLALLPRMLRGGPPPEPRVDLPGAPGAAPVLVAPTAFHRLAHPEGELATARAAAATGTVLISSMAATTAVDEVVAAAREVRSDAAVWFQLYLQPDPEVTARLVERAESAGCTALVVTVDSPVFGDHVRDRRNGFHDLPPGYEAANMRDLPGGPPGGTRDIEMSPEISWRHLEVLRATTALPVLLKGILHPDDAHLAVAQGVDGIIVSNHGGRQLDAAPAPIDVLPRITRAIGGTLPLLLDGGVRRGTDVVTALALGAEAVGIGRPVLWGLAADGEKGVREVLDRIGADVVRAMALCGVRGPDDLTANLVVPRGFGGLR
ncbi:alpha-hydroxy acid oxidase [Saccharopolyspora gregorii]|uniref:Alpha-hydroxy acid oxidase n=1 Tax=Saccharopolyspora gregorii TaxID=33914 RepID=A0ABP6RU49_9PSEU